MKRNGWVPLAEIASPDQGNPPVTVGWTVGKKLVSPSRIPARESKDMDARDRVIEAESKLEPKLNYNTIYTNVRNE